MLQLETRHAPPAPQVPPAPGDRAQRLLPRAAGLSFAAGLIGLRVCWLPGVNCVLALAALVLGIVAFVQIARGRGRWGGLDEAIAGVVMGVIVMGVSVFFISAVLAAWR